jgi:hypothetical protein
MEHISNIYPQMLKVGDKIVRPGNGEVVGEVVEPPIWDSLKLYATVKAPDGEVLYAEYRLGHRYPVILGS